MNIGRPAEWAWVGEIIGSVVFYCNLELRCSPERLSWVLMTYSQVPKTGSRSRPPAFGLLRPATQGVLLTVRPRAAKTCCAADIWWSHLAQPVSSIAKPRHTNALILNWNAKRPTKTASCPPHRDRGLPRHDRPWKCLQSPNTGRCELGCVSSLSYARCSLPSGTGRVALACSADAAGLNKGGGNCPGQ